jgi:hypothetical protein
MANLNTIKNWFKTGLKPNQLQFWETWDSFWHKDEQIPIVKIDGIETIINAINNHIADPEAHLLLERAKVYQFKSFQIFKASGNFNIFLEIGDIGIGWLSETNFITHAIYLGGDKYDPASWDGDFLEF